MKVTLVGGFSPHVASAGGVRQYVESLSHYLSTARIPHISIVAGREQRVGPDWCSIRVRKLGSTANWLSSLAVAVGSLPIPADSIVHAQRPDELAPFLVAGIGRARICTLHGDPRSGMHDRWGRLVYSCYAGIEACVLRQTDRVIFVDTASRASYLQRYPWLSDRSEVIPNGVDDDFFSPADSDNAKRKWGLHGKVFLYAGRLEPEKRVVEIVRAFRDLNTPGCALVIAGSGSEENIVRNEARSLNVRFLGNIARSEMPSLINAADAILLYSTREGLPSVVLEALACGVPVIVTPVGALPNVVVEGETGLFVRNRSALTQAMAQVCRGRLGTPASIRRTILQYSWTALGPRVVQTYLRGAECSEARLTP